MCLFACSMNWTHCEIFWDLDFWTLWKNQGRAGNGIVGGAYLSWILIVDPWVLSPDIPLAASHCYLDCPEPPNHPKSLVVLQGVMSDKFCGSVAYPSWTSLCPYFPSDRTGLSCCLLISLIVTGPTDTPIFPRNQELIYTCLAGSSS